MKALHLFVWVIGFGLASCTPGSKINKIVQKELLTDSSLQHAHIGICVYDPSHSQFLYQYQSEKYFIPASNTKLFSLYAALRYLGDSITGLEYVQTDSALWIRPTGDPSFLSPHFTAQPVYEFLKNSPSNQIRIDWPAILPDSELGLPIPVPGAHRLQAMMLGHIALGPLSATLRKALAFRHEIHRGYRQDRSHQCS